MGEGTPLQRELQLRQLHHHATRLATMARFHRIRAFRLLRHQRAEVAQFHFDEATAYLLRLAFLEKMVDRLLSGHGK